MIRAYVEAANGWEANTRTATAGIERPSRTLIVRLSPAQLWMPAVRSPPCGSSSCPELPPGLRKDDFSRLVVLLSASRVDRPATVPVAAASEAASAAIHGSPRNADRIRSLNASLLVWPARRDSASRARSRLSSSLLLSVEIRTSAAAGVPIRSSDTRRRY